MKTYESELASLGVKIPEIYLPKQGTDFSAWATVACDQYSSEREYWEDVKKYVGSKSSSLNVIFPECYLEDADSEGRIKSIQNTMNSYLNSGVLSAMEKGFILVDRKTPFEKESRKGLMIALDLEKYAYGKESKSLIRPTEGTIVERLPPRMKIRKGAPLEMPHIMVLIDDPEKSVIEPIYKKRASLEKVYDFDLMMKSGHLTGYKVNSEADFEAISKALKVLGSKEAFKNKYNSEDILLFAVGDGNHSLATAKAIWEEIKNTLQTEDDILNHPARYALVELVNMYDEGLPFHPIHRVLFNANADSLLESMHKASDITVSDFESAEKAYAFVDEETLEHRFALISENKIKVIRFIKPRANLACGTIQEILDSYLKANPKVVIDYIHGTESLTTLSQKKGNCGLYLPPIDKNSFYKTVIRDGVMPRKTFSMGEAPEKRFYVEARKIIK